ncbi:bactofilin family protein [Raoultella ornithinolytica]|uniref:bactofilin family protein n=1 Tax=Raoultella ornithinolytica TaxID=54291 RepID=UPI0021B04689|nr:polymer-forming cytoskeletal protein [Raoultella ornithinolytica]MCT4737234.1 polymer-forming cytoskeletal protein [Raoultella ornithinolytica]
MRLIKRGGKIADTAPPEHDLTEHVADPPTGTGVSPVFLNGKTDAAKPVSTRKDTFISSEACLQGNLEGRGNVVIEGQLEGNICSSHQVRVESGGRVVGDIRAQHIMVNGHAEGHLHADAVTVQSDGRIEGAIFADTLVIERGGIFIGQSCLKEEGAANSTAVAAVTLPVTPQTKRGDISPVAPSGSGSAGDKPGEKKEVRA